MKYPIKDTGDINKALYELNENAHKRKGCNMEMVVEFRERKVSVKKLNGEKMH